MDSQYEKYEKYENIVKKLEQCEKYQRDIEVRFERLSSWNPYHDERAEYSQLVKKYEHLVGSFKDLNEESDPSIIDQETQGYLLGFKKIHASLLNRMKLKIADLDLEAILGAGDFKNFTDLQHMMQLQWSHLKGEFQYNPQTGLIWLRDWAKHYEKFCQRKSVETREESHLAEQADQNSLQALFQQYLEFLALEFYSLRMKQMDTYESLLSQPDSEEKEVLLQKEIPRQEYLKKIRGLLSQLQKTFPKNSPKVIVAMAKLQTRISQSNAKLANMSLPAKASYRQETSKLETPRKISSTSNSSRKLDGTQSNTPHTSNTCYSSDTDPSSSLQKILRALNKNLPTIQRIILWNISSHQIATP